jgi:glycosyltransferase involved in cell wall biosynthesis
MPESVMKKEPLISILTVVFNQRPYIYQTINSILTQTYQNWEWIILDDGSTDGTGEVLRTLNDNRIHYTLQQRIGGYRLTESCNKALSMCTGKIIAMLDGDDYWPEDKLETQVKCFDHKDVVLSYGECCLVNSQGKKIGYMVLPDEKSIAYNDPVGSSLKLFFKRYCFMATPTVMVKREALEAIGGFIEVKGLFQDFTTWTRLSLEGRFSPLPRCLGFYRRHPMSLSFNSNAEELYCSGIDYLRNFAVRYEEKLHRLGFEYNINSLEQQWKEMIREFVYYLPYNRALSMLKIGSFKDAKLEFRNFLEKFPSLKTSFVYLLVILSGLLRIDIVNPLSALNQNVLQSLKGLKHRIF